MFDSVKNRSSLFKFMPSDLPKLISFKDRRKFLWNVFLILCCAVSIYLSVVSNIERAKVRRVGTEMLRLQTEMFALTNSYLKQEVAFSKNAAAFDSASGDWIKYPIQAPVSVDDARSQIAKLKAESEQLNASAITIIDAINKQLAQLDGTALPDYGLNYLKYLAFTKNNLTSPDAQARSELYNKEFTCFDQALADLQANPFKWKRDSDGKLVFLDEELQAKVRGRIDEWVAAMKQFNDQFPPPPLPPSPIHFPSS